MLTVNVREAAVEPLSAQWSKTTFWNPDTATEYAWPLLTVKVAGVKPVATVVPPLDSETKYPVIAFPAESCEPMISVDVCVTVNWADAVPDEASVAATGCAPAADPAGTAKVAVNAPCPLEVIEAGVVLTGFPSYLNVMAELAANPVPLTVTVEPVPPEEGDREISVL